MTIDKSANRNRSLLHHDFTNRLFSLKGNLSKEAINVAQNLFEIVISTGKHLGFLGYKVLMQWKPSYISLEPRPPRVGNVITRYWSWKIESRIAWHEVIENIWPIEMGDWGSRGDDQALRIHHNHLTEGWLLRAECIHLNKSPKEAAKTLILMRITMEGSSTFVRKTFIVGWRAIESKRLHQTSH